MAGGGSALEQLLIESAREDRVPAGAAERVAVSLRAHFSAPIELVPGGDAASLQAAGRAGWVGSGWVGAGLVLAAALHALGPGPREDSPGESSPELEVARSTTGGSSPGSSERGPAARQREEAPLLQLEPTPPNAREATPAPLPPRAASSAARPRPTRAHSLEQRASGGLLDEVRSLDRIRAALQERRAGSAARELAAYRRRFPRAELGLEADVLAVEVALESGRADDALRLADAVAERSGSGRYSERLAALRARAAAEPAH